MRENKWALPYLIYKSYIFYAYARRGFGIK